MAPSMAATPRARPAASVCPRNSVMSGPGVMIRISEARVKAARISGAGRMVIGLILGRPGPDGEGKSPHTAPAART